MRSTGSRTRLALPKAFLWVLRLLLAAVFLSAGVRKWLGTDAMTATFADLGAGQWLRYVTGTLEIAGAIGLLIPSSVGLAALMLVGVMAGAAGSEAFLLEDGNPTTPAILLALAAMVAWHRRETILPMLEVLHIRSFRGKPRAR